MIYFIADTHFDDKNILNYENRPFSSVIDMNQKLIENWNKVVSDSDEIYVVGDFGNTKYLKDLKGIKYLIKGNHDTEDNNYYRKAGFKEVYDKPVLLNNFWILSHEPLYVCENMPYANIFGHVHNSPIYKDYSSHHFCVTVERTDYSPISFDKVKRKVTEGKTNV